MIEWGEREQHNGDSPRPMPDLIWKTLSARGLRTSEALDTFFSPKLKEIRDPMSMKDMDRAVERLVQAFENRETVCIYGDFDLDGSSGLALVKDGLEQLGFEKVIPYQPLRLSEGYGLHSHAIEKLSEECSLVVTVDVGITAVEAAETAKRVGVDLIITDHHQPAEVLPDAVAVVNPNQTACESGLGHLCGAGVGFFLFLALRRKMAELNLGNAVDPKSLLDCFVIGTLTDLVPLVDENRVLVKHGLIALEKTTRPGLRHLLKQLNLAGRPLSSQDVAIRFAPKINALSRMEKNVRPMDIFLCDSDVKAKNLIAEVMACNEERIERQKFAEGEAEKMLAEVSRSNCAFVQSREFHQGVVGLVATKVSRQHSVPAFIGACNSDGMITGSARRPEDSEISLLDAMESASDHLVKFGGHNAAAGFELKEENAESFSKALQDFYSQVDEPVKAIKTVYDGEGKLDEINPTFMRWYENMGPFGVGFETPVFLFRNLRVLAVKNLKQIHYKLTLQPVHGFGKHEALWFSPPANHQLANEDVLLSKSIDLVAEPQWNYFAGRKTIQLLVVDVRTSGDA